MTGAANRWPDVRFDDREYDRRHAALRAAMGDEGVDALVLGDDRLTWWLTGFGDATPIGSAARPRVLVLPRDSDPVFFVHGSTHRCVVEMSAVADVRGYPTLGAAPIEAIVDLLAGRGCARVAWELGGQLRCALALGDLERIRQGCELVDAAPLVWPVRSVKSEDEVRRIRAACAITDHAYREVLPRLRAGATERAVQRQLIGAMLAAGAHTAFAWVASGPGEFDRIDGVVRDRTLGRGDLVFVDAGACVGGYWSDYSRAAVLGAATESQRRNQELVVELTAIGVDAIRPGVPLAAVGRALDDALAERGLVFSSEAGRYGHGLGMAVTEPPDVSATDETIVEPGMVLTVEPGWSRDDGMYHCEENVLVTDGGLEVLSTTGRELVETG